MLESLPIVYTPDTLALLVGGAVGALLSLVIRSYARRAARRDV